MTIRNQVLGEEAISTTELSQLLGFTVSVRFLGECGVPPLQRVKRGRGAYWRRCDIPLICAAIQRRVGEISSGSIRETAREEA